MFNNVETIGQLFEYAIALERAAEALYRQFSEMFSDYHEVALFWKRYADEEKGHAAYLERVREAASAQRLSCSADGSVLQRAHKAMSRAAQIELNKIHTLEDAHQLATELENAETNAIFEFMIVNFSTEELAVSHQFLRTQLKTHIARLEKDFPAPYKSGLARQTVLVSSEKFG